jgi:hypothetical protein
MSWQQLINEIVNFLLYPKIPQWFLPVKFIFISFGSFFLIYIFWAILKTSWLKRIFLWDLKEFLSYRPYYTKIFAPKWEKIEKRLESKIEADLKLAVLEADELLDQCLSQIGYPGATLDEKLEKLTEEIISNLKALKEVRKIKEDIVEDPNFRLTLEEAKKILETYKRSLQDLQAL